MAKKFQTSIDLNKFELQNAVIQNLGSAPGTPSEGQIYYDTVDHNLYVRDNGGWVDLTNQGTSAPDASDSVKGLVQLAGDLAGAGSTAASPQITAGAISATEIAGSLKPTGSAAAGDEALRALGTTSSTALAGNTRLDQIANPTASVSLNSQKITNLADGTLASDAVNLGQLQTAQTGLDSKASVRAATTGTITISTALNDGDTIDGVTLATNDRVLVKDQGTASQNGIYVVGPSPARATDMDNWSEVPNAYVWVEEGTANADTGWVVTSNAGGTIDSTNMDWTQFSGLGSITAGNGLTKTSNTLNVVGTASRISVAADAIDIDTNYVGQASITTLGTITTGTWTGTNISVAQGGTGGSNGAQTAAGARGNLSAAGYYSSATHGAGTTISVPAATHGLRASTGLIVQVQNESDGAVEEADVAVAANGDVVVTFGASQSANTKRVTIIG